MSDIQYGEVHPPEEAKGPVTEGANLSLVAHDGTKVIQSDKKDPNGSWRQQELNGFCCIQVSCGGQWYWLTIDLQGHVAFCSSRFTIMWNCRADGKIYSAPAANMQGT